MTAYAGSQRYADWYEAQGRTKAADSAVRSRTVSAKDPITTPATMETTNAAARNTTPVRGRTPRRASVKFAPTRRAIAEIGAAYIGLTEVGSSQVPAAEGLAAQISTTEVIRRRRCATSGLESPSLWQCRSDAIVAAAQDTV